MPDEAASNAGSGKQASARSPWRRLGAVAAAILVAASAIVLWRAAQTMSLAAIAAAWRRLGARRGSAEAALLVVGTGQEIEDTHDHQAGPAVKAASPVRSW